MQYEFTRLEKLLLLIYKTGINDVSEEQIKIWTTEILDEKERLQIIFEDHIGNNADAAKVDMYLHHHYNKLSAMLAESETSLIAAHCKVPDCLKDLIFYFELNLGGNSFTSVRNLGSKCYIPLSVEVLALLFKLLWDEGIVRMKFKSELARTICNNVITLKAGEKSQLSEKHFLDAQYHCKESTLNAAEKIINKLKMRLNHMRRERNQLNPKIPQT